MKKNNLIKQLNAELDAIPVPDVIDKVRYHTPIITAKNNQSTSRYSVSFRFMASFMAIVLVVFALYAAVTPFLPSNTGYTTLSIDINPSVELTLNEKEEVTAVTAVNSDAQSLLNELDLLKNKVELAIEKLLNKAIEQGFLTSENSNAILFSVKNKKQEQIALIEQKIQNKVNNYLNGRNISNTIIFEEYHEELMAEYNALKEQFEENVNITPAKYQYMKRILQRFPALVGHEEYLAKMSIVELHQLLTQSENSPSLQDLIERIIQNIWNNGGIGGSGGLGNIRN